MSVKDLQNFDKMNEQLHYLIERRSYPNPKLDQRYITQNSIIRRMDALLECDMLEGRRVLAIGDADLSGLSTAIFGSPSEVVVADIDNRLSELLFEANIEFELPTRFVYHDMRIKIIAILKNQYDLIIMEPPRTKPGIEVFISRAVQCIENEAKNGIFITVPSDGEIREFFHQYISEQNIHIVDAWEAINQYQKEDKHSDFIQLGFDDNSTSSVDKHWTRPFFESEVSEEIHNYMCQCRGIIKVGAEMDYTNINDLKQFGCPYCDSTGEFAYQSEIEMK